MPTVSAPANKTQKTAQKPVNRNSAPPKTMSSSTPVKDKKPVNPAVILFVIAALILCGLLGTFMYKSFKNGDLLNVETPTLSELPKYTSNTELEIKGGSEAKVEITIYQSGGEEISVKADKEGKFIATANLTEEKTYTFKAKATKKFLFWTKDSPMSEEITTTLDLSAPSITMKKLPKTVTSDTYKLTGKVSEPGKITAKVNGTERTIETEEDGNFSIKINLKEGKNSVVVIAKDLAGNETATTEASITYNKGTVISEGASVSSVSNGEQLPESAGILSDALNTIFTRYFALTMLSIGVIGYFASSNILWLFKSYSKR